MSVPLISCIMPTADRRRFVPDAIRYFLRQSYPEKELLILDDGVDDISDIVPEHPQIRYFREPKRATLGEKRNRLCDLAKGELIAHFDDDDWMAPWRLCYQVRCLRDGDIYACGLKDLFYYNLSNGESWKYVYPETARVWLAGGTLCYTKRFWAQNPFPKVTVGEDTRFIWGRCDKRLIALDNARFYVAMIHSANTSRKKTADTRWHRLPVREIRDIMGRDWVGV